MAEIPDVVDRLAFHAERVEECGHLNAARWMREAVGEIVWLREQLATAHKREEDASNGR